jgi:hypothetical protein
MNQQITLESLVQRVEALEQVVGIQTRAPDNDRWLRVVGMFAGSDFMKQVDEEGRKIREAERARAHEEPSQE